MRNENQATLIEILADDSRSVQEWADGVRSLARQLYEHDPELTRALEKFAAKVTSIAGDLVCLGTEDPTAPPLGANTREVLALLFRRCPPMRADLNRNLTRAAQCVGRAVVLAAVGRRSGR